MLPDWRGGLVCNSTSRLYVTDTAQCIRCGVGSGGAREGSTGRSHLVGTILTTTPMKRAASGQV